MRERYFDLYDLAPVGIFTLDGKGVIQEANLTVARLLATEREVLLKRPLSEFVLPDQRERFLEHFSRFLSKDATPSFEVRMQAGYSATFWARIKLILGHASNGALLVRAVLGDITEEMVARDDLLRLRVAVDHAHDGIAIADMEGRLQFVNIAWAKMHGYAKEEMLGKPLALGHTKEQLEKDVKPFNKKVLSEGSWAGEVGHVRKDGTVFQTWMSTVLLHDAEDRVTGLIGMADDITERRRAENELARILHERETILKTIPDIFYRLDMEMNLQDWNEVFEVATGYPPQSLRGMNALKFFRSDVQTISEGLKEVLDRGQAYRTGRLLTRSGEEIPYFWSGALLRSAAGEPFGFVGIGRKLPAD